MIDNHWLIYRGEGNGSKGPIGPKGEKGDKGEGPFVPVGPIGIYAMKQLMWNYPNNQKLNNN